LGGREGRGRRGQGMERKGRDGRKGEGNGKERGILVLLFPHFEPCLYAKRKPG